MRKKDRKWFLSFSFFELPIYIVGKKVYNRSRSRRKAAIESIVRDVKS